MLVRYVLPFGSSVRQTQLEGATRNFFGTSMTVTGDTIRSAAEFQHFILRREKSS